MFQYAAALALAARGRAQVLVDATGLGNGASHYGFELSRVFETEFPVASDAAIQSLLGWRAGLRNALSRRSLYKLAYRPMVVEPHFAYWREFERLKGSQYLAGYWQSEQYFTACMQGVRAAFKFRAPNAANRELSERINSVQAVSVHVRRGDYAANPAILALHGLCSPEYYRRAIKLIGARVRDPQFFVFSDDLAWCRDNLEFCGPAEFIGINRGDDSFNDMRLMSLCRHHIIANSTFSWWGAWLNPNDDKIVIAPRAWFSDESQDTSTIYPPAWIRL